MIKYVFVSIGKFESFGFRFGGAGLGNLLIPWAYSIVFAKQNNLERISTSWSTIKIGTFVRRERDKRMYLDLFKEENSIRGLRKFWLLNFTNLVRKFSSIDDLFLPFKDHHAFVVNELISMTNSYHLKKIETHNSNSISIHIRMGDFSIPKDDSLLRKGLWNYRVPLKWYIRLITKIRKLTTIPIYIFSDGSYNDIEEILKLDNCEKIFYGSAISDMLAMSRCKLLIASGSTFSMWSSFIGQVSTVWFPGQMRQKLLLNNQSFEGEIDYDDELPQILKNILIDD